MTTTITARPAHRNRTRVVLAAFAALTVATVVVVTARNFTGGASTNRPSQTSVATESHIVPAPGAGLPCPIHQAC
jgi:hypothetical protein